MRKSHQFFDGTSPSAEDIQKIFLQEKMREETIRKDPDTVLCARIKIKHAEFMQELPAIQDKIEASMVKTSRGNTLASLVQQYIEKIREYQKIFRNEQAELDQIKKIRRDNIFPFEKALELELIEINKRIKAATDPFSKKILKKGLLALKEYAKATKQLEKDAYNIVLSKKELSTLQNNVADLEQKYKRLLTAMAKGNEKFFAKLAKARKLKKAKLQNAAGARKNNVIKQTVEKIKTYLVQYRKDMKEFDARFTQLKHEVHFFRVPSVDKKHSGLFKSETQDVITLRLSANANAQKIMERIKSLQTNLQAIKRKGDKINDKIAQRANREVLAEINASLRGKRDKFKSQLSDGAYLGQELKTVIINSVSEYLNSLPASQKTTTVTDRYAEFIKDMTTGDMRAIMIALNELFTKNGQKYDGKLIVILKHDLNKTFETLPFQFTDASTIAFDAPKTEKLIDKQSAQEVLKEKDSLAYDLINTNISAESKQALKDLQKCLVTYQAYVEKEIELINKTRVVNVADTKLR